MLKPEDCKEYEILLDGTWSPVNWQQLEVGDIIRAFKTINGVKEAVPLSLKDSAVFTWVVAEQPALRIDPYAITEPA